MDALDDRAVARVWLVGSGRADGRASFPVADPALAASFLTPMPIS
jgi:hypothetical protein